MKTARRFIAWIAVALLVGAGAAAAEQLPPLPPYTSPQRFALEFKLGPYTPQIDDTSGLTGTPFFDIFSKHGEPPAPALLGAIEFDWQFFRRPWGSLGVAMSAGFSRRSTGALIYPSFDPVTGKPVSCQQPNCQHSGESTALYVIPIDHLFVFRFELLANRYRVPLVPYVKAGFGYYLWWITRGGKLATALDDPDDTGIGGTWGLVAQPGIAVRLDALDPGAARTLDVETGINHTYAFFEMNYGWINGFGIGHRLNLSDLTWYGGLAFEF